MRLPSLCVTLLAFDATSSYDRCKESICFALLLKSNQTLENFLVVQLSKSMHVFERKTGASRSEGLPGQRSEARPQARSQTARLGTPATARCSWFTIMA